MVLTASTGIGYRSTANLASPRYEAASTGLRQKGSGWANYPGVREYACAVEHLPFVSQVSAGVLNGVLWIITEVDGPDEVGALRPLFEAELAARTAREGAPIVFRVVYGLDSRLPFDGPTELIPVR